MVPDDAQTLRYGLLGCSVVCHNQTTDHPMVGYLSREYGKPFYHCASTIMSEMLPSASNRVFLTGERDAAGFYRPGVRCVFAAGDFLNVETTLRLLEKLGYDIESRMPGTGRLRFIEVKGRVTSAATVTVTKNEILYSLNKPDDFILAIVEFLDADRQPRPLSPAAVSARTRLRGGERELRLC